MFSTRTMKAVKRMFIGRGSWSETKSTQERRNSNVINIKKGAKITSRDQEGSDMRQAEDSLLVTNCTQLTSQRVYGKT